MTISYINTGSSPNAGDGDNLRTAFGKINTNLTYIVNSLTEISASLPDIGPTGPTGPAGAGIGTVETGIKSNFAYYPIFGNTVTNTNILNFNDESNLLVIGSYGNTSSRILHVSDTYFSLLDHTISKFSFHEHHDNADSNNIIFLRTRGSSENQLPIQAGDDIADIGFHTLNNQNEISVVSYISVGVTDTSTTYPKGIIKFFINTGTNFFPKEVVSINDLGTLKVDYLDSITTGTSLQVRNNLIPSEDLTYDLGSTSSQWRSLYVNEGIKFSDNTTQTTAYTGVASPGTTATSSAIGYLGMPQNNQTSTYIVAITDQGKHIYCTGDSFTVTIPANTVTSFPVGSSVAFIAGPTTTATIAIQTDTMYLGGSTGTSGTRMLSPFGMATAVKVDSTTWFISGAGLA